MIYSEIKGGERCNDDGNDLEYNRKMDLKQYPLNYTDRVERLSKS